MMILFNGNSLSPKTKFQPEKLSLQLTERSSTASMTVKDTAPTMAIGDWLKIEDGPGSDIVWRVKTIDEQYEKHTRTISLEHMINSLKDKIIFDEVKSEYISGQAGVNPTNADTIRFILEEFQRDWVLGGVAGGHVRNPYTFNGDTLYSALGTVTNSIEDSFWQYDMSRYPFRIDIGHLTGEVRSEMRMDRNIRTIKKTVDRSGMFTKFFPVGKNNLHIIGDSVSMNTEIYGVICKSETDQSKDTEEELNRWAHDRIRRHCEPTVTITISGLDLAKATGESLDSFHIGYLCRVPLPEYNTTILERITKLSYSDVVSDPMNVTVTLANNLEDVASIINNLSSTASTSSKAAATKAGQDHAWIEDTEDHVALVAEAIIGPDENGVNWSRVSSVVVDGQGIHQQVVKAQGDIIANSAKIDINENRILQEVTDRTNADGELQGRIIVQADRITQEVVQRQGDVEALSGRIIVEKNRITQEVNDRTNKDAELQGKITVEANRITQEVNDRRNADTSLSGRITTEAGKITQIVEAVGTNGQVTAASIVLAINEAGDSEARINANKVYIGSQKSTTVINGKLNASDVTAAYIAGKIAQIQNVSVQNLSSERGGVDVNSVSTNSFYQGDVSCYVPHAITQLQIVQNGNTYTLQRKWFSEDTWTDVGSFSRATTITQSWDSGSKSVKATASGASDKYYNVDWRFISQQGGNYVELMHSDGSSTISLSGTSKYIRLGLAANGTTVQIEDQNSTRYVSSPTYSIPLQDKTVASTGITVYPSSGYVGLSSVTIEEEYPNEMTITRASWHSTSGTVRYGKLYYWDDDDGSYQPVINQNKYWYYSDDSKSGTTTVHY